MHTMNLHVLYMRIGNFYPEDRYRATGHTILEMLFSDI